MTRAAFADRAAAGEELGRSLIGMALVDPLVLGLARGGVVVAAAVAKVLDAPLDVLVVRKLGHPRRPELGLGALAEDGEPVYDDAGLAAAGLSRGDLAAVVTAERAECRRRVLTYRRGRAASAVQGRTVVVVDDGVATGVTARAALVAVRGLGAARVLLAAPVASRPAVELLCDDAEVVTPLVPRHLGAVSRFYDQFAQTSDAEVLELLRAARPAT